MNPHSIEIVSGRIASVNAVASGSAGLAGARLSIDGRDVPLPAGAIILPGFVDTHCHLIGLGEMASRVGLRGAASALECVERVARHAAGTPAGSWIIGFGWNQEEWRERRLPDRHLLDRLVDRHPVVLYRVDTHAAWLNGAALAAAGITAREVEGGSVELGPDGAPNGILIDNAIDLVRRVLPPPDLDRKISWLEQGVEEALRFGITEIHDMNVEPERLEPMTRLAERGGMRLRCRAFLQAQGSEWKAVPHPTRLAPNLDVVGVKYFADGALGSYGALLLDPYADRPATRGLELLSVDELAALADEPASRGFAVATHAIGDGANRLVLDAYERLRARHPEALLRVEHAQIVHPDDVPRFGALGVIAAMQAIHCTSDASMADARLGPERAAYAYGWRALRDAGATIIGGSDFPIESADPLLGIRAFVDRIPEPASEAETAPWHPEQRLTLDEALAAYTSLAPRGVPGAARRGMPREGGDADLVVLDGDPMEPASRVAMTIVGGVIEYSAL